MRKCFFLANFDPWLLFLSLILTFTFPGSATHKMKTLFYHGNFTELVPVLLQGHIVASEMVHFVQQVQYYINFEVGEGLGQVHLIQYWHPLSAICTHAVHLCVILCLSLSPFLLFSLLHLPLANVPSAALSLYLPSLSQTLPTPLSPLLPSASPSLSSSLNPVVELSEFIAVSLVLQPLVLQFDRQAELWECYLVTCWGWWVGCGSPAQPQG